jgi:hypothetical protein
VPEPICVTAPPPEITPAKVIVSERSNANAPLFVTSPTMLPEHCHIYQVKALWSSSTGSLTH